MAAPKSSQTKPGTGYWSSPFKELTDLEEVVTFFDEFAVLCAKGQLPRKVFTKLTRESLSYDNVYDIKGIISHLTASSQDKELQLKTFKLPQEPSSWIISFLLQDCPITFLSISESTGNVSNFTNGTKLLLQWTTHLYQYNIPSLALAINIKAASLNKKPKEIETYLQHHIVTKTIQYIYNKQKVQIKYNSTYPFRLLNAHLAQATDPAHIKWKEDNIKANNRCNSLVSPFTGLRSKDRLLTTIDTALSMNGNNYGSFMQSKKVKKKRNIHRTISPSPSRSRSTSKSPPANYDDETKQTNYDDETKQTKQIRLKLAKLIEEQMTEKLNSLRILSEQEIKQKYEDINNANSRIDEIERLKFEEQQKSQQMEMEYYELIEKNQKIQIEITEKKNFELLTLKKIAAQNEIAVQRALTSD